MNLKKSIQFTNDLRQIFIDYVFVLDDYFEVESNINEHNELYLEYENLRKNYKEEVFNAFKKKYRKFND